MTKKTDALAVALIEGSVSAPDQELARRTALPSHWQAALLGEVASDFISGGTPSTQRPELWDGIIPWTTSAPIDEQATELDRAQRFITEEALASSATHIIPQGGLLVGTRVGVGKAVVTHLNIAISQDLTGVVLDRWRALPEFVAYQFKTGRVQDFLAGRKRGTTIKGVSRFDLEAVVLQLPPLPEQRAIAHILRTVQDAIQARRREVALERERKAALMQHLFTHGTRGEPTKLTEIGEMPESWNVVRLGDHALRPEYGYTASAVDQPLGPQFLRITDIQDAGVDWNTVPYCICDVETSRGLRLMPGDIVIARIGATTGKSFLIETCPEAVFASYLIRVRAKAGLNPAYLHLFCQTDTYWRQIDQTKGGRLKFGVNIPILQGLVMPLPPIYEQGAMAEVLCACDTTITAMNREAKALAELFRALLEELMTGRLSAQPLAAVEVGVPA
jgi:type I restriction enzyme S subunit